MVEESSGMLPDKIEKGHKSLGMRREPVQRKGWPARTDYIGVKIDQLLMWLSKHTATAADRNIQRGYFIVLLLQQSLT